MNSFIKPAVVSLAPAVLEIDGVQFRSDTPKSEAECRRINYVGSIIVATAMFPRVDDVL